MESHEVGDMVRTGLSFILRCWLALALWVPQLAWPAEIRVAVAANFHATLQALAPAFTAATGHTLRISTGASGALYTQIEQGAPFDVFLSADRQRPQLLEQSGRVRVGSRVTYAYGVLVLWSAQAGFVDEAGAVLRSDALRHLAIAEPRLAPYGAAAEDVLRHLGVWEELVRERRIVKGQSIAQTLSLIDSGAAELGFIAASQLQAMGGARGSFWYPPAGWHAPLAQDAVVLNNARDPHAAQQLLDWLRHDEHARAQIGAAGYRVEDD